MELKIKGCSDCLFLSDTFSVCTLQARLDNRSYTDERDATEWDKKLGRITPEWCPLKKSDGILVKLNKASVIKSVCVSCDEETETHQVCMKCISEMIADNQQTVL